MRFFAKIVPGYNTPYLRKFGGIKVTGSPINIALWVTLIFVDPLNSKMACLFFSLRVRVLV